MQGDAQGLIAELEGRANKIEGLSTTSSSKYNELKAWLQETFEAQTAVCYLSEFSKQWIARVGQALMGMPRLLVLLVEGQTKAEAVERLEALHQYATGLHATIVLNGTEGAWKYTLLTGTPGRALYEQLALNLEARSVGPTDDAIYLSASSASRPETVRDVSPPNFLALERTEQADLLWGYLVGSGARDFDEAIREAANMLRDDGYVTFERLRRDGPLYLAIEEAIASCTRRGVLFDRPARGQIRAVIREAADFSRDHWRDCIRRACRDSWMDRDVLVREAADWAVEIYGLDMQRFRTGGKIDTAIRSALNGLIRLGEVERQGTQLVRKAQPRVVENSQVPPVNGPVPLQTATDRSLEVSLVDGIAERSTQPVWTSATLSPTPAELRAMVGELPGETEAAFAQLLAAKLHDVDELRTMVKRHLSEFEEAFKHHEFLDLDGAEQLASESNALLDRWAEFSDDQRRLAQAAILYFVESDEADDDFRPGGLRTDKAVFAAVTRALATTA